MQKSTKRGIYFGGGAGDKYDILSLKKHHILNFFFGYFHTILFIDVNQTLAYNFCRFRITISIEP
jgi:hypothetical protein